MTKDGHSVYLLCGVIYKVSKLSMFMVLRNAHTKKIWTSNLWNELIPCLGISINNINYLYQHMGFKKKNQKNSYMITSVFISFGGHVHSCGDICTWSLDMEKVFYVFFMNDIHRHSISAGLFVCSFAENRLNIDWNNSDVKS